MSKRLAIFAFLFVLGSASVPAAEPPITPGTGDAWAGIDEAMQAAMKRASASGSTIAISKGDKLLYSRGYGWRDLKQSEPTKPETPMRIASCGKPITAAVIQRLIQEKKLTADTRVAEFLELTVPAKDDGGDARWSEVTIGHLLAHRGGWDRAKSFDPMFREREVKKQFKLDRQVTPDDIIRYMLRQPLDFAPGERSAYSNFGYCLLGRVIEKASGRSYLDAVKQYVGEPAKLTTLSLGRSAAAERDRVEVEYDVKDNAFVLEWMDAHGGIVSSAPDLCRFLQHFWISGQPRKDGSQNWTFYGSLPGTTAMIRQRADGHNVSVLLNGRGDGAIDGDLGKLQKSIDAVLDEAGKSPAK